MASSCEYGNDALNDAKRWQCGNLYNKITQTLGKCWVL